MVAYVNNTAVDISLFHPAILDAIAHDGQCPEELSDIFTITKNPPGSSVPWSVDFVE